MHNNLNLDEVQKEWHGSLRSYLIGFGASLLLSALSFSLLLFDFLSLNNAMYALMALAILQSIVQAHFFLHVGEEPKPRWETLFFFFMIITLLTILIGSLWIMHDLHHRAMPNM